MASKDVLEVNGPTGMNAERHGIKLKLIEDLKVLCSMSVPPRSFLWVTALFLAIGFNLGCDSKEENEK